MKQSTKTDWAGFIFAILLFSAVTWVFTKIFHL